MRPKYIAVLALLVLALIVLIQNTAVVTIEILFWSFDMSQVVLIVLMLAIGFLVGFIFANRPKGEKG